MRVARKLIVGDPQGLGGYRLAGQLGRVARVWSALVAVVIVAGRIV